MQQSLREDPLTMDQSWHSFLNTVSVLMLIWQIVLYNDRTKTINNNIEKPTDYWYNVMDFVDGFEINPSLTPSGSFLQIQSVMSSSALYKTGLAEN